MIRFWLASVGVLSTAGMILGFLNWLIVFREAMHSRGILVVCLLLGLAVGATTGVVTGLVWKLSGGRFTGRRPAIVPYTLAWAMVGPLFLLALVSAALPMRQMRFGLPLVIVTGCAAALAAAFFCARVGRLFEQVTALRPVFARSLRLGAGVAAVSALTVMMIWLAAPRFARPAAPNKPVARHAGDAVPPNVILVSFDTLRPDHLSALGYPRKTSPHIDDMINRSVLFTETIGSSSWTIPSHASLLTGASPSRIGPTILSPATTPPVLPETARTLAEILGDRGYRTAAFIGGATMRSTFGFAQGFDVFDDLMPPSLQSVADKLFLAPQLRDLLYVEREDFLRGLDPLYIRLCNLIYAQRHQPPKDSFLEFSGYPRRFWNSAESVNAKVDYYLKHRPAGPQFLFVHYFDPHSPYDARSPFFGRWGNDGTGLGYIEENGLIEAVMEDGRKLTRREKDVLVGSYDEKIAYMDAAFGALMTRLEEERLLDGAIVALFSDHGESFGEHNDLFHGHSLDEELIRILFSIRFPGAPPAGMRIGGQVRAVDIMPTILELAGIQDEQPAVSPPIDGVSLVSVIRDGGRNATPRDAISELFATKFKSHATEPFLTDHFSLRSGGWKLVLRSDGRTSLYNLMDDPGEHHDLAMERQDLVLELGGRLSEWLEQGYQRIEDEQSDPGRLEELKGLGYIDAD